MNKSESESEEMNKVKEINIVIQGKGGVGKSVFGFMYATVYPKALIIDADEKNQTATDNLRFHENVLQHSFHRENQIDELAINELILKVSKMRHTQILVDTSAAVSESLVFTFKNMKMSDFAKGLKHLNVKIVFRCIIGGGDLFNSTLKYAKNFLDVLAKDNSLKVFKNTMEVVLCKNNHKIYTKEDFDKLNSLANNYEIPIKEYNLIESKGDSIDETVSKILLDGKGIHKNEEINYFTKLHFNLPLEEFKTNFK